MTDLRRSPWLPALFFLTVFAAVAILPVLPSLRAEHGLSDVQTAALLSVATLATLLVALPLGWLGDRLGARPLVVVGGVSLALSCLLLAVANSFALLLVARALFGISDGIIWTLGLVVYAGPGRPAKAMGRAMAIGGVGQLAGPLVTGALADTLGSWIAWLVIGVVASGVTLGFMRARDESPLPDAGRRLSPQTLLGDSRMVASLVLIVLSGLVGGIANLLAPQQLDANGVSPTVIGAIFAAGALVWIITAGALGRVVERRSHAKLAACGCGVLALAWIVPTISLSTFGIAIFLLFSAGARAGVNTVTYLLARAGAIASGNGTGAAIGIVNVAFSGAALAGPLLVAVAITTDGARLPYAAVAALCLAVTIAIGSAKIADERRVI